MKTPDCSQPAALPVTAQDGTSIYTVYTEGLLDQADRSAFGNRFGEAAESVINFDGFGRLILLSFVDNPILAWAADDASINRYVNDARVARTVREHFGEDIGNNHGLHAQICKTHEADPEIRIYAHTNEQAAKFLQFITNNAPQLKDVRMSLVHIYTHEHVVANAARSRRIYTTQHDYPPLLEVENERFGDTICGRVALQLMGAIPY